MDLKKVATACFWCFVIVSCIYSASVSFTFLVSGRNIFTQNQHVLDDISELKKEIKRLKQ